MKNRERGNWDDFNIYDVFWDENSIVKELEENDFHVVYLIPVGVKSVEEDPVSWTVAAMKY
jgi:beta-glucanase (GH16 family)